MRKHYILEVEKRHLRYVTDMLRYDDCFRVEQDTGGEAVLVHTLLFTPERWRSFGYVPKVNLKLSLTAKEAVELLCTATGFVEGLRFAYRAMKEVGEIIPLVEDS